MKKLFVLSLAGLAAACTAADAGPAYTDAAPADGRMAREIAQRTPGQPIACIPHGTRTRGPEYGGPGTLLFEGPGNIVYLNRTQGNCGNLRNYRSVRFTRAGDQLCRGDTAQTFDPHSGVQGDFCILGDFVPYHRTN